MLCRDALVAERMIEVKTTCGANTTPFFLTENERSFSEDRPDAFRIFRIYEFGEAPRFFKLRPPLEESAILKAATYRAHIVRRRRPKPSSRARVRGPGDVGSTASMAK